MSTYRCHHVACLLVALLIPAVALLPPVVQLRDAAAQVKRHLRRKDKTSREAVPATWLYTPEAEAGQLLCLVLNLRLRAT